MKSLRKFFVLLVAGAAFTLTSCMTFSADELAVLKTDSSMKMLGHFEKEVMVNEFLGSSGGANLFNVTADEMSEKLDALVWKEIEKKGGNGAINVKVEYKASFLDIVLNSLTLSIWAPAHLKVSGDVIQYGSASVGFDNTEEAISVALMDF